MVWVSILMGIDVSLMGTPFQLMVLDSNPMGIDVNLMGYHFKPWFQCQSSWGFM
jgi:hypothetical protein